MMKDIINLPKRNRANFIAYLCRTYEIKPYRLIREEDYAHEVPWIRVGKSQELAKIQADLTDEDIRKETGISEPWNDVPWTPL